MAGEIKNRKQINIRNECISTKKHKEVGLEKIKFQNKIINENDDVENKLYKSVEFKQQDTQNIEIINKVTNPFEIGIHLDVISIFLFFIALCTRIYKLHQPNCVVFDELHYGKYISMYMKGIFYFDHNPPLGKQIVASVAKLVGFDGNYTFSRIGSEYTENVPIFWLRFVPAVSGSILAPCVYKLLLQMKLKKSTGVLGGFLIIFDNALLTQSRFILMESMLLTFSTVALLFLLKFHEYKILHLSSIGHGIFAAIFFTMAFSVKIVGFYTFVLCVLLSCRFFWNLLSDKNVTNLQLSLQASYRLIIFAIIPVCTYLIIFYYHLNVLNKAGPHDSVMTSAFQASLEGGLASITKGQPLKIVHGSQITLRHTLGRTCWLHSHTQLYPVRYPDNRGSSHQQQVTCYSFKDVNNWWIIKKHKRNDLVVGDELDLIKHNDHIYLIHGITSRALNSHDVAAPISPQCQEVSCYIDYNVSMPGDLLWKVDIINRDQEGPYWHAIKSQVRLVHVSSGHALRYSGRQLPEWGFNQHEIVADRTIDQPDTIWNVEEHRYTKSDDQRERERQLINAEMIPTGPIELSFWSKFLELQMKMIWSADPQQSHMYESQPIDWPLMNKGIAYWVDKESNAQIHLLGNIVIWYSGTAAIVIYCCLFAFYYARRLRLCFDLADNNWRIFCNAGELFLGGYLIHFIPYLCIDQTLFLHNYFPALIFKILLLCFIVEHLQIFLQSFIKSKVVLFFYYVIILFWIVTIIYVFMKFIALSYGTIKLSSSDIVTLRWKETWDLILHRDFA